MNTVGNTIEAGKAKSPRLRDEFDRWMKCKGKSDQTRADYLKVILEFVIYSGKRGLMLTAAGWWNCRMLTG